MNKEYDVESITNHKNTALAKLDELLDGYINDNSHIKKADLISYWIEEYANYIRSENDFNYKSIPNYKRGDVIKVNFGFNIGSEHGGLHYAVVIGNNNIKASPVITVIPLSSSNKNKKYDRDVLLGDELHEKLVSKYNKLNKQVTDELNEVNRIKAVLENSIDNPDGKINNDREKLLFDLTKRVDILSRKEKMLSTYAKEISKLKEGSVALIEQITTVSKMRIYNPKSSSDLLYGIKLSTSAMDKIDEKIKELYVFNK